MEWLPSDCSDRLQRQIEFIHAVDRLKKVERRSLVSDGSRRENSAEHSWHVALMAILLAEYANQPVDLAKVVVMLLIHDIVEILAGDTFVYDESRGLEKKLREAEAAARVFGLLPEDQASWLRELWEEFEQRETNEARFAAAIDRVQPIILNLANRGRVWQEHGITLDRVLDRNAHIVEGSEELWVLVKKALSLGEKQGFFTQKE